jgi:hypothetical protein
MSRTVRISVYFPQLAHEADGTRMYSGCLFDGVHAEIQFLELLILDNYVN